MDKNNVSVYDLMQSVANHLAEKPVNVRFKEPNNQDCAGTVSTDTDGNINLDIKPGIQHDQHTMLETFANGCANALYSAVGLTLIKCNPPPASSIDLRKVKSTTPEAYKKAFADTMTERWMAYVRSHQSGQFLASFEENLNVLLGWKDLLLPKVNNPLVSIGA